MAKPRHFIWAAFFVLVGLACATTGIVQNRPTADVRIENVSFDILTVRVFCDGRQVKRFSQVIASTTEQATLRLFPCTRVTVVAERFGSRTRPIIYDNIIGLNQDGLLIVVIGNTESTSAYRIRNRDDLPNG
jgi:hypothetical protein